MCVRVVSRSVDSVNWRTDKPILTQYNNYLWTSNTSRTIGVHYQFVPSLQRRPISISNYPTQFKFPLIVLSPNPKHTKVQHHNAFLNSHSNSPPVNKLCRVLLIDTETNGLPNKIFAQNDLRHWPIVLQVAWCVLEIDVETHHTKRGPIRSMFIKPPREMVWCQAAENIHGISQETLQTHGVKLSVLAKELRQDASMCSAVIGHNVAFDVGVLNAAFSSVRVSKCFLPSKTFCTSISGAEVTRLSHTKMNPLYSNYRQPKLCELYFALKLVEFPQQKLHSADGDVECLQECVEEMLAQGHIKILQLS